jgi:predicted RNase H-like HicB family nuclease
MKLKPPQAPPEPPMVHHGDHIYTIGDDWFFEDEANCLQGPYETKQQAEQALKEHVAYWIEGKDLEGNPLPSLSKEPKE